MTQALRSLFPLPDQYAKITHGVARAVETSFGVDVQRASRHDLKDRTHKAIDIVCSLRGDLHWPIQRILDQLPGYLKATVHGQNWEPDDRKVWLTSDGVE